jgi:hypothetical protein
LIHVISTRYEEKSYIIGIGAMHWRVSRTYKISPFGRNDMVGEIKISKNGNRRGITPAGVVGHSAARMVLISG